MGLQPVRKGVFILAKSRERVYEEARLEIERKRQERIETEFILPNRLKEIREGKYLSQAELARRIGVCKSTISMWEHGIKGIKDKNKIELCRVLKCDINSLFDWGI